MVAAHAEHHDVYHASAQGPRSPLGWILAAGYIRCLWTIPMMFGIGVGIMAIVRLLEG